ncbi:transposase [uncultured Thiohalocapsa sp.]|uniref:transposase n=1 Tax=uncultured Thiohalocapsa sp. TaxID=768990 RepID=UPI0025EF2EE1|nr:transposase [uncultured Thiohalocapsa sp.]
MHVILRGTDRAAVFFHDEDWHFLLSCLAQAAERERVAVHAYVLMTNHIHLLMTATEDDGVSRVMKRVGQRYVQNVNRSYRRTGGLFEGRFRSSLIEADGYLLACCRYIELNPVRAGMVSGPDEYPWSSYRANALGEADAVVTPHALYQELARSREARLSAYRGLFAEALSEGLLARLRACTNGGFVLGSAKCERQIAAMVGRRTWKGSPGRPRNDADVDGRQQPLPLASGDHG